MSNPIRVVGAVFHDGERFLACRKKPGKPLEGHWEFPGGKIEPCLLYTSDAADE